jgi:hypothetical protein
MMKMPGGGRAKTRPRVPSALTTDPRFCMELTAPLNAIAPVPSTSTPSCAKPVTTGATNATPYGPNGNLYANNNAGDGLFMQPTPGALAFSLINGLTASSNGRAGLHLLPGDVASVAGTTDLSKAGPGILVSRSLGAATVDDLSNIQLGEPQLELRE